MDFFTFRKSLLSISTISYSNYSFFLEYLFDIYWSFSIFSVSFNIFHTSWFTPLPHVFELLSSIFTLTNSILSCVFTVWLLYCLCFSPNSIYFSFLEFIKYLLHYCFLKRNHFGFSHPPNIDYMNIRNITFPPLQTQI